ncbi:MarR family transcriptional regulator [Brachybacterium endophyticum]|uniref:MarR family transcriptional regulator n=1 Tax=Brachybacterium endophyticum TaxID=2182385 RepID=A0A2U2RLA8_9MICO|nr:MarR family winged helix-turn-helix transcriptional regulator [Brachybacterium endophyticum]PWH06659.1 MarR family transcriptional regulator [Brachybacterium endophyticum]
MSRIDPEPSSGGRPDASGSAQGEGTTAADADARLGGEDPLMFDLADGIVGIARLIQVSDIEDTSVAPLNGTEIIVLRWVHRHPGTTSGQTARATGLHRSNMSTALRGLVTKGLVERESDPEDSRRVHLRLTAKAEEHGRIIRLHWARVLRERIPDLDAEDRAALERTIGLLTAWEEGPGPR